MLHYSDREATHLEQPYFTNIQPDKPIVQITADRAELLEEGKNIYLFGNVSVVRGEDVDKDKITMTTSFLHLVPDEDIARTDKAVTVVQKSSIINAVGMELNNRTGILQLFSRVRAVDN
jgi:lipopolysaccharide export system protein LptC